MNQPSPGSVMSPGGMSQNQTSTQTMVKQVESYSRAEGVEHNVINGGTAPMSYVEVELK